MIARRELPHRVAVPVASVTWFMPCFSVSCAVAASATDNRMRPISMTRGPSFG